MSVPMKKHPTKEIVVKVSKNNEKLFVVPKHIADGILKILSDFEFKSDVENTTSWRDVPALKKLANKYGEGGAVVRGSRLKEGLTQKELAEKLGTSQSNVAALESGSRAIGKEMAKRLAKIFKADYRVFL